MEATDRSFEIAACLGRGGFGEVYRARMYREGGLEAEVALKVLRRDINPDGQAVQRLRDEGRLLSQLNHPAILKVHDLVVLSGRISLVTEYVDGDDLTACLEPPDRIATRALLQVIAQVAGALDAAWTAQPAGAPAPLRMVHRDIKPSNIRLSRHGDVKLLDFGIARTDHVDREARTRTGMMVGSPAYMAPERFLERDVLLESDVFSLGAVLYEGVGPDRFYGDMPVPMQVGMSVREDRYTTFLERQLGQLQVAAPIADLLRRTLAYRPSDRPTPAALARECDALADTLSGPSLARFCRARSWSTAAPIVGELDGHTLTEGSVEIPRPDPVEPPPAPPSRPAVETLAPVAPPVPEIPRRRGGFWGWVLVGVGTTGLLGTVGAVALSVLGFLTLPWAMSMPEAPAEPTPLAEPAPPPEPLGNPARVEPARVEPAEPAPVAPDPEPEPAPPVAPSRPEPTPAPAPPRPEPEPEPVVAPPPDPVPAPPPVPTGPPPGRIDMEGDVVALAIGPGGTHILPASLAPGTYQLKAKYNGRDAVDAGTVVVKSGQTVVASCSSRMTRCTLR